MISESGWKEVEPGVKINFTFQNNTLQIKTNYVKGSGHRITVQFYDREYQEAGGVQILFEDELQQKVMNCPDKSLMNIPATAPDETEKVWTIHQTMTKIGTECNGVLVLEFDVSECGSEAKAFWEREVTSISILEDPDTASSKSEYRPWLAAG